MAHLLDLIRHPEFKNFFEYFKGFNDEADILTNIITPIILLENEPSIFNDWMAKGYVNHYNYQGIIAVISPNRNELLKDCFASRTVQNNRLAVQLLDENITGGENGYTIGFKEYIAEKLHPIFIFRK